MTISANDSTPVADLQFDSVERADGAAAGQVACNRCKTPLAQYHTLNGEVVCGDCRRKFEASRAGGYARLPLAVLFGAGAALLGAIIYVGVAAITNLEVGLIAILVGWMVGKAVKKGSGGKGGLVYQLIAVGFIYLSILSLYFLTWAGTGGFVAVLLLPLTQGLKNIIGLAIIAFGLFQAWKGAEEEQVTVLGPFEVKARAEEVPAGV
jgi:hypothetical protein